MISEQIKLGRRLSVGGASHMPFEWGVRKKLSSVDGLKDRVVLAGPQRVAATQGGLRAPRCVAGRSADWATLWRAKLSGGAIEIQLDGALPEPGVPWLRGKSGLAGSAADPMCGASATAVAGDALRSPPHT